MAHVVSYVAYSNTTDTASELGTATDPHAEYVSTWNQEIDSAILSRDGIVGNTGISVDSNGDIRLREAGYYLIGYSEQFGTPNTENTRTNWGTWIRQRGLISSPHENKRFGYDNGYVRRRFGSQEDITNGAAIIYAEPLTPGSLTSFDTANIVSQRTDDYTGHRLNRITRHSGVYVVYLGSDDSLFGLYTIPEFASNTADQGNRRVPEYTRTSGTFSHALNAAETQAMFVLNPAGKTLFTYSLETISDEAQQRREFQSYITSGTTLLPMSHAQTYYHRESNRHGHGGMSAAGFTSGSLGSEWRLNVLTREGGGTSFRGYIQVMRLPATVKSIITAATSGDINTLNQDFPWATTPQIDPTYFGHTANSASLTVRQDGPYFAAAAARSTQFQTGQRAIPAAGFAVNSNHQDFRTGGIGAATHSRGVGTAYYPGLNVNGVIGRLKADDTVELNFNRIGTESTPKNITSAAMGLLYLPSLFATDISATTSISTYTFTGAGHGIAAAQSGDIEGAGTANYLFTADGTSGHQIEGIGHIQYLFGMGGGGLRSQPAEVISSTPNIIEYFGTLAGSGEAQSTHVDAEPSTLNYLNTFNGTGEGSDAVLPTNSGIDYRYTATGEGRVELAVLESVGRIDYEFTADGFGGSATAVVTALGGELNYQFTATGTPGPILTTINSSLTINHYRFESDSDSVHHILDHLDAQGTLGYTVTLSGTGLIHDFVTESAQQTTTYATTITGTGETFTDTYTGVGTLTYLLDMSIRGVVVTIPSLSGNTILVLDHDNRTSVVIE